MEKNQNKTHSEKLFIPDSTAVSMFVVILVELTNTVNSTNLTTNIETAALSNSGQLSSEREY